MPLRLHCFALLVAVLLCFTYLNAGVVAVEAPGNIKPEVNLRRATAAGFSGSLEIGQKLSQPAVNLQSNAFDDIQQHMSIDDTSSNNPSGRPLTLEATPLEGMNGESVDSMDAEPLDGSSESGSGSFSGSSSGSVSYSGSSFQGFGGSSSGSSLGFESSSGSVTPIGGSSGSGRRRKCVGQDGITPGPCGGGGPLVEAKIVPSLTGGGKKFQTYLQGQGIWTFQEGNFVDPNQAGGVNEKQVQKIIDNDSVAQQLFDKYEKLQQQLENEKIWVEDVQIFVDHYKQKAGAVAVAMKNQAKQLKVLEAMIQARKKLAARKALEMKLQKVNQQLQRLQATTSSVSGEAKSLTAVQGALNKSIQSIQSEIEKLRSTN